MGEGKRKEFNPDKQRKDTSPVQVHIRLKRTHEESAVYNIFAKDKLLHSPNDGRLEPDKWQVYDHIHSPMTSNADVYKVSGFDLVENALKGYNTAVFAYGQQGSGKTRTLMSRDGITAYTVSHLFNRISKIKSQLFTVSCSYLQIYNEHIYDLLNPDSEFECTVREHKTRGLYVENVTRVPCKTPKDVYELINIGRRSLVLAETKLNLRSSRSHAVCQLQIDCIDKSVRKKNSSILNAFSPFNEIIDEENEAYIDFDTVPFQRKNIKRSHSIAITKMNERSLSTSRLNSPRASDSEQSDRCSHVSHHKEKSFIKKSHSFRGDRLPSYSKRFQDRRYFNMSSMVDVKLYRGNDFKKSEETERKDDSQPSGIPVPMRYPSIYNAALDPAVEGNIRPRKTPKMSMQIPRLIRKPRGIDDSGVESNTSQSEEDISDISSDHGSSFYIPNRFQTSEHYGSEYLDLANHDENRFFNSERSSKNRFSNNSFNIFCSKISIVDLAGSERVKKSHVSGERLKEAQHINLSLLELGNVISALADGKKKHVPYRNSVLTRLLQDTLGGNSKLTFLLCVSTKLTDVTETKCTLEFGQKLKKILTTPTINVDYYKWKYENAIADQKRKQERKQRQEARRLKLEQECDTDQIEYNNVITQYDQSKTLIDMLQYMMGLNGIQPEIVEEADSLLTDVDTGTETDDTLTEASDLDADFNDEEDQGIDSNILTSHDIAFSDISLDDSVTQDESSESVMEENTVDFDLFEIPEPIINCVDEEMHSFEIIDNYDKPEVGQDIVSQFELLPHGNSNDPVNSHSLEEFLANEMACFNDIDAEPPLMTSSPNCTNEDASSSDETDSLTDSLASSDDVSANKDTVEVTEDFSRYELYGTDQTRDHDMTNTIDSKSDPDQTKDYDVRITSYSEMIPHQIKKHDMLSESDSEIDLDQTRDYNMLNRSVSEIHLDQTRDFDIPCKIFTGINRFEPLSMSSEDVNQTGGKKFKNAKKLDALRAKLRNTQHLHHVRNGCWCQKKQHV